MRVVAPLCVENKYTKKNVQSIYKTNFDISEKKMPFVTASVI